MPRSLFFWGRRALLVLFASVVAACGGGGNEQPAATPQAVATLEITQSAALFTGPGQEKKLALRALDASGQPTEAGNVVWTSSAPEQVAVDAGGTMRSVAEIGSAAIVAEVNGVRSAPVFVATVALKPGTLMVRDVDVIRIGDPVSLPPGGLGQVGMVYDVWLAPGMPAPAIGAVVLAAETAVLGGKVVETQLEPNQLRVRLQTASAPDLLARYDVNWSVDLRNYPLLQAAPTAAGTRERPLRERPLDSSEQRLANWKLPESGSSSPLSCEGELAAKLESKPVEVKFSGSPVLQVVSSRLDATLPPGRLRIALVGDVILETTIGLVAKAGLHGTVKCELQGTVPLPVFPPPIGPFIRLGIPLGIGASVSAEVEVASIDIGLSGQNGASVELGIDCKAGFPCVGLDKAERINKFKPHLELHSLQDDGPKITLDVSVYLLSGIQVLVGAKKPFGEVIELVDITAGPKQAAEFSSVKRQAGSASEASKYELTFDIKAGPGKSVKELIARLMGDGGDASLSLSIGAHVDISTSPNGDWQPDKTQAIPGRDSVTFNIDLLPPSTEYFLLGYNVKSIEIYRRGPGERLFSPYASVPGTPQQAKFQWVWTPVEADAGQNEFAAFVKTSLPVVELEIAPNSVRSVNVGCVTATANASGAGRARPLASGQCKEIWSGNAAGRIPDLQAYEADLTWTQEQTLPPRTAFLRPTGTVRVQYLVYDNLGCTVSPSVFSNFRGDSHMTVNREVDPPAFGFIVIVEAALTITCGDDPPTTLPPTSVVSFSGGGKLTADGTLMAGSLSTPQGGSNFRFELVPEAPPPPPPAAAAGSDRRAFER